MEKLGFVIVNYNDYEETSKLLNNIKDYSIISKIVVVDNMSKDDSYDKLKMLENDKIIVIKNSINRLSSGWNYGAKYLINELGSCNIIFSNSDIIINSEEDLISLNKTTNDEIKVVGPVIKQNGEISRGWPITTTNKEILFNLVLINRYFKKKYLTYSNEIYSKDISIVDVVSGCFFLVNSKALEEVNYFDENTYLYYEENILARKIKNNNYKEAINNKVSVIHNHSVTIDKSIKRVDKYKILKNSQKYYVYNYLNPNVLQKFLLFITNKISLLILYIRCIIRI